MTPSPITPDSGNTTNSSGFPAENIRKEESRRIKERLKAEEEKVEGTPATKNEARASEETEREEKNRRMNDWRRRGDEKTKEAENRDQARVTQPEKKTQKLYFETANADKENGAADNNRKDDSVTLSKTAARLNNLTTRFENTNNRLSVQSKDWATDEDVAYQQLQITKTIIQQQSSAAIFSQANVRPEKVISLFQ